MHTNTVMNIGDEAARRRLILALGRGKSGKTLWSRWLVETMRARGVSPVAADADFLTLKSEMLWQPHRLRSSGPEKFCGLHGMALSAINRI